MNTPSPEHDRRFSREEFRRWYELQPTGRYERVDGRIVAMAPERGAHLRVKGAAYKALDRAIAAAGVFCQALPAGATVETGDSDYQPDAFVNGGEPMHGGHGLRRQTRRLLPSALDRPLLDHSPNKTNDYPPPTGCCQH